MKQWTPKQIKDFRKRLGLTQSGFAALVGVTNIYVNYLEKGVRNPSKTMRLLLTCLEQQGKGGNENGSSQEG